MQPGEFYKDLKKSEKSRFLSYCSANIGVSANTLRQKLCKGVAPYRLSILEHRALEVVIEEDKWRTWNLPPE